MNALIDISGIVLHTQRLTLRPFCQDDLEDFFRYASVDGVGQMAGWAPHKDREETQRILDLFISHKKTFAVVYQGEVVGSIGIEQYNEAAYPSLADKRCREIGYVLSKTYWGMGLMPEAVNEVIRYLFEDVGLDAICCQHATFNRQSQRVQEKCGFQHVGNSIHETSIGARETVLRLLTREAWATNR